MPDVDPEAVATGKRMLRSKGIMFIIAGAVFGLSASSTDPSEEPIGFLLSMSMVILGIGGGIAAFYYSMGVGKEKDPGSSDGPYFCKHCHTGFTRQKQKDLHERSCIHMKI